MNIKNPMEIRNLSPYDNEGGDIGLMRQKLAEKVKFNLSKYQNQITNFNFGTVTGLRGEFDSLNNLSANTYDYRYKEHYELFNFDEELNKIKGNGYIYSPKAHFITFQGYLGTDLRRGDDRNGNKFVITIAFDKNGNLENEKEVIDSIMKLLETISPHEMSSKSTKSNTEQQEENIKKISEEGLPIVQAFEEIGKKYENGRGISMQNIIKEYKTNYEK